MKKRCLSFLLSLVLFVGGLSACTTDVLPMPAPIDGKMVETVLSFETPHFSDDTSEHEKLRDIVRAVLYDKIQKDSFVTAYLTERGMYKPTPDGTYGYGNYYAEYYTNEENRKTSFILYEDISGYSEYCMALYCISFSWDDLSKIGSIAYEYNENQDTVFEGVYLPDGTCTASVFYEYFDGIPFPFVKNSYIAYTEFENGYLYDDVLHMNKRFWLEKEFAVIDEAGRVTGYHADLYGWQSYFSGAVYNDFVYDNKGKLIAIYEELSEEDGTDAWPWEFATDITLEYRDDNTLSMVDYGFYYMNYKISERGTGDSTGKIFYDEQERMIYRTYYMTHGSHSCFYLYEGDSKRPWAYIDLGGLAYSGDDISEYGFDVSIYLFQPPAG